ncbi:MAG TPA: glycoside hydrolase family 57 protein [Candidatus Saccharimonadales bacterium]|nr:glycoside hydrolase family 57 protein [Candidatus Saccharimonadales bacterium]
MTKAIALYLHVHQPYRIRHYTVFDSGNNHDYFDAKFEDPASNERIIKKITQKSYLPTNTRLLELLHQNPEFKLSLSITGTVIEQLQRWSPEALESFKRLTETGRVEILAETYHHSLAFFYSRAEFEMQVDMHKRKIQEVFGQTPTIFRNTELAFNNELANWADMAGYKGVVAEGWDPILGWRSPNYVYQPAHTEHIKLLLKNYRLSDDIAFRFGDSEWNEWPLTADKFSHWLSSDQNATNFNLFMDYETFGEHQWDESGIFGFLEHLPGEWLKTSGNTFMTLSEVIDNFQPVDKIDVPDTVTWADTERDLSAWLGNAMQAAAITALYGMEDNIIGSGDLALIDDWRRLQTSDHFYYMCTKWFNDGDIHAYFSPYDTPYEGYINFMNAFRDIQFRLAQRGISP